MQTGVSRPTLTTPPPTPGGRARRTQGCLLDARLGPRQLGLKAEGVDERNGNDEPDEVEVQGGPMTSRSSVTEMSSTSPIMAEQDPLPRLGPS